ncbi:protein timeless-like [Brevipalpus obovatus]|uniref:protein timeless-like n=1 Tax=Brevipalpus obovatus TaxID=246614 RepID=UPI003D9F02BE
MEYLLINRSTLQALCSSIGWTSEDGKYKLSPDCFQVLCAIEEQLRNENVTTRTIRLSLGLSRFIERDLLKILESIEIKEEIPIVRITLKILVNLTLPPEWLLTGESKLSSKGEGLSKRVRQLQKILLDSKKAFVKTPRATAAIIQAMKVVLTPGSSDNFTGDCDRETVATKGLYPSYLHTFPYSNQSCEHQQADKHLVKDCLLIFRNLLYIPEKIEQGEDQIEAVKRNSSRSLAEDWQDTQQRVIWNLLVQGLDNSLLNLMNSCHRHYWTSYIVQVIALLYRDQPVNKMGHHISSRSCYSDNSEDDIDSDHTLSAQRSSSTSVLSDSSSKDSGSNSNKTSKNDSGFYHPTESDKTSSDGSFQSGEPHTEFVIAEKVSEDNHKEWNKPIGEVLSRHYSSEDLKESFRDLVKGSKKHSSPNRCEPSLSTGFSSSNGEKIEFENQEENNNVDGYVEGILSNQTSGFSGSSEDDCNRKMHKVMKPHQRSNSPNESDSSDESDYLKDKMSNRGHHHVKKVSMSLKNKNSSSQLPSNATMLTQAIANSRGTSNPISSTILSPPIKKKSGCHPSICMDAAVAKALATLSTDNSRPSSGSASTSGTITPGDTRITFPWDKKHTCGSKGNSIGSESPAPSEGDIRFLLEEFTLKFLHNFFASQICDLTKDSVNGKQGPSIDMSHTLWLLGYFLKISNILDLSFSHLRAILTPESFGLLVFNGLLLNEELEQISMSPNSQYTAQPWIGGKEDSETASRHINMNSSPQVEVSSGNNSEDREESLRRLSRKLQLLITALKEMIITVSNYINKPCLSEEEKKHLDNLCISLSQMRDLRQFFLLLIRCYSPVIHPKSFLMDVILAHHHLLLLLDGPYKNGRFDLASHLRQFSTIKVMEQYGQVLESFRNNSESLNDCVFTLMHHVAGDLGNPECLFQPTILKTFSLIMESELELIDSWEGLMEYVMNRFIKAASNATKPTAAAQAKNHDEDLLSTKASTHDTRDATVCSSQSYSSDLSSIEALSECSSSETCGEKDQLYWLFLQYEQTIDPISCILEALVEEQGVAMERRQLISTLKTRGLINQTNELRFIENDGKSVQIILNYPPDTSDNEVHDETHANYLPSIENLLKRNDASEKLLGTDILIAKLRLGYADQLTWVSNLLVDICNMKMHRIKKTSSRDLSLQPLAYFSEIFGHSAPLIPFTEKQELAMNSKPMLELFRRLGFQLPNELGKLYLRVPTFFSPDIVFQVANKLSQVPPENLSFRIEEIMKTGPDLDSCCNSVDSLA